MFSPGGIGLAAGSGVGEGRERIAGESARQARTAADSKRDIHSRSGLRVGRLSVGRFFRLRVWLGTVHPWNANLAVIASTAETTPIGLRVRPSSTS
jgi:hypothetical protein